MRLRREKADTFCLFHGEKMIDLKIQKKILSFREIPELAAKSQKAVLMLRHSIRESLNNGTYDPELTKEGFAYALECGSLLAGLEDVCFCASPRKRTIQTAEAVMQGAELGKCDIRTAPEIKDTVIFETPEDLYNSLAGGYAGKLLKEYYSTGKAAGMIDLKDSHAALIRFLTETEFEKKNCILTSHDIIVMTLLAPLEIYPFTLEDWCGYVQGAALFMDEKGKWSIYYTVPDAASREKYALFV